MLETGEEDLKRLTRRGSEAADLEKWVIFKKKVEKNKKEVNPLSIAMNQFRIIGLGIENFTEPVPRNRAPLTRNGAAPESSDPRVRPPEACPPAAAAAEAAMASPLSQHGWPNSPPASTGKTAPLFSRQCRWRSRARRHSRVDPAAAATATAAAAEGRAAAAGTLTPAASAAAAAAAAWSSGGRPCSSGGAWR